MSPGAFGRYALGSLALVAAIALAASLAATVAGNPQSSAANRVATKPPLRPQPQRPSTPALPGPSTPGTWPEVGLLAQSVSFVSPEEGYVLGAVQCGRRWCPALRRTTDRGATWAAVGAPPAPIDATGPASVAHIAFASPLDGFAFGPGLWETDDGGRTWQRVSLPGAVAAFAATGRQAYALVVSGCTGLSTCRSPAMVFESQIGAGTWHSVPGVSVPGPDFYGAGLAVSGEAVYVTAGNALLASTTGTVFRRLSDPCPPAPPTPPPPGFGISAVAAGGPAEVAVLCGGGVAGGSQAKLVYVSGDGGASFRELAVPPFGGDNRSLAVADPTTLFVTVVSGGSDVYRTTGGDTRWTTPVAFGDGGLGIADLAFVTPTDGAMLHGADVVAEADTYLADGTPTRIRGRLGVLYLTDDGGTDWVPTSISD